MGLDRERQAWAPDTSLVNRLKRLRDLVNEDFPNAVYDPTTHEIIWNPEAPMSEQHTSRVDSINDAIAAKPKNPAVLDAEHLTDAETRRVSAALALGKAQDAMMPKDAMTAAPASLDALLAAHEAVTHGPRVTAADLDKRIYHEYYFTAEDGVAGAMSKMGSTAVHPHHPALELVTICVLIMKNRYRIVGTSSCVSPENFNADIGRQLALRDAIRQAWALEAYLLAERTKPTQGAVDA